MILFNVGYDRMKSEPLYITVQGMEYNVETHEDTATFTLKEFERFIKSLNDARDNFVLHLH